ncbi:MAG: hypothetical protein H6Q90_6221 [Deltaproteobacteria bacterium]|nr:hypothetical protein [Deltaproteobacteria bacterium]
MACGTDDATPAFPADYAASYALVRSCRSSSDHDLHKIRVLADPAALAPYRDRAATFPTGAIVLKEEYDFADSDCSGPVIEWTVMEKIPTDDHLGWSWQRVDAKRAVVTEDDARCITCHAACGVAPDGYAGTCAVP